MPKKAEKRAEKSTEKRVVTKTPVSVVPSETELSAVPPKKRGRQPKAALVRDPRVETSGFQDSTATNAEQEPAQTKKPRQTPTRESVEQEFTELVQSLDEEIARLRSSSSKSKGVKFLRTINKRVKALRTHALRVSKQRQSSKRNNSNSGFCKPVQISRDLARFTGWDQGQLRSRVDVTKYICDYIKKNNLQNPEDRRQIRVNDDPELKRLLQYDSSKDDRPLTYYRLQTYLKSHFTKPQNEATEVTPVQTEKESAKSVTPTKPEHPAKLLVKSRGPRSAAQKRLQK